MINNKQTFFLGLFIIIIPALGLPTFWKTTFFILSGVVLVFLSIKITLPKRTQKKLRKKEKITRVFVENSPIYTTENIKVLDYSDKNTSYKQE